MAEERTRIARDLHDSAGHAISVIAVRAGAARLRGDPQRSQAALEAVEELARQTVAEMDLIVGALRGSGYDDPMTPYGAVSMDTLVSQHRAAGLAVEVEVTGGQAPVPIGDRPGGLSHRAGVTDQCGAAWVRQRSGAGGAA